MTHVVRNCGARLKHVDPRGCLLGGVDLGAPGKLRVGVEAARGAVPGVTPMGRTVNPEIGLDAPGKRLQLPLIVLDPGDLLKCQTLHGTFKTILWPPSLLYRIV